MSDRFVRRFRLLIGYIIHTKNNTATPMEKYPVLCKGEIGKTVTNIENKTYKTMQQHFCTWFTDWKRNCTATTPTKKVHFLVVAFFQ